MSKSSFLAVSFCVFTVFTCAVLAQTTYELVKRIDIEPVWSGHPVGFALLTKDNEQFAAYYDAGQNLTVAQRSLGSSQWTFTKLPTKIGWDSHNYVTMAVDSGNFLHVSGNMHCVPLIYFRSEKPLDASSLKQIKEMTGQDEKRCTYPAFINSPQKELLFTYRDGSSGNGKQIWNVYDAASKKWTRLFDTPMFDGQDLMNAYFHGPVLGPDGYYHISYMWRDTPDCSTNHDLSYIRSKDMRNWENSRGEPVKLPITIKTGEIIDKAQPGGGLLNPAQSIGFDTEKRVIISYGRYDENGNWQLYNARLEDVTWKYYQTSDWNYRWDFKGGGTIVGEISFSPVQIQEGKLVQSYRHIKEGSGRWFLDNKTLKPIGKAPSPVQYPKELSGKELDFPTVSVRSAWDLRDRGEMPDTGSPTRFVMYWEAQGTNRDRPHPQTPPPSMLRLFEIKRL
ncbi:MAG: BNR repeat-containing protein [Planctomycetaceae bacterium]|nr:BNR repeat-containing protein [Planctomycetaceae bacterium]